CFYRKHLCVVCGCKPCLRKLKRLVIHMLSARVDNTVNPSFGFGGSRMEGKGGKGIHPIQRDLRLEKQSFDGTGSNTKSGVRTGSLTYQQSRQIRNPEIMFIHQFFDKKKQLFGMRRL